MPLEGCPPQPGAPAVAGRLLERSKGKDTTTGHWELMGVVTPTAMPTYPHGFPHDVIDPFMHRTGRGVLGNKAASGTEIIQELGEEHQQTGKWIVYTSADSVFQIAAHEETIPLEELYEGCEIAREILTGKHAVGRVIARPFAGEPGSYERTPEPARLLARAAAAELPLARPRRRPQGARRRQDRRHLRRLRHRRVVARRSRTSTGSTRPSSCSSSSTTGFVFVNLVETDMLWGHRNDPVNFHRCLQDFDRRLEDILEALRPGDLLILTSDHGCDPTTPSTDHSREHALLLAYAAGRNAHGRRARGRVRRRRRDRERLARRQGAGPRHPGHADPARREGLDDPSSSARQYATEDESRGAPAPLYGNADGPDRARGGVRGRRGGARRDACSRSAAARVSSRSGSQDELGVAVVVVDSPSAWSSWHAAAGSTPASATSRSCRSTTARSTAPSPRGCSSTSRTSTAGSPSSRGCCGPADGSSPSRTRARPSRRAARPRRSRTTWPLAVRARERRRAARAATSHASSGATSTGASRSTTTSAVRAYLASFERDARLEPQPVRVVPLLVRRRQLRLRRDEAVIRPAELIERKRNGEELPAEEIAELILGYARGEIPDYQLAAFCMAVYFRGLTARRDVRAHRRDDPQRPHARPRRGARAARSSTSTRPAASATRRRSRSARSSPPAACRSGR